MIFRVRKFYISTNLFFNSCCAFEAAKSGKKTKDTQGAGTWGTLRVALVALVALVARVARLARVALHCLLHMSLFIVVQCCKVGITN